MGNLKIRRVGKRRRNLFSSENGEVIISKRLKPSLDLDPSRCKHTLSTSADFFNRDTSYVLSVNSSGFFSEADESEYGIFTDELVGKFHRNYMINLEKENLT